MFCFDFFTLNGKCLSELLNFRFREGVMRDSTIILPLSKVPLSLLASLSASSESNSTVKSKVFFSFVEGILSIILIKKQPD